MPQKSTRTTIKEVIEKLRYRLGTLARSLLHQRSNTLGVVVASLKYIGLGRMLSSITAAAEKAGYVLLLKEISHFDDNTIESVFRTLLSRHEDGIIWAVPEIGGKGPDPVDPQSIILPPTLVVRRSSLRVMEGGESKGS